MNLPLADQLTVPAHFRVQPEQVPFTLNDLLPAFSVGSYGRRMRSEPLRVPDDDRAQHLLAPRSGATTILGAVGWNFGCLCHPQRFGGAPAPPEIIEIVSRHAEACRLAQLHFECDRLGRLIETLGSHFSWRRPGPDSQSWLTTHSKRSLTVGTAGPASKFTIFKHPLGAESALYPLVNLHNYGILWKINENHHFLGQINYVHQRVIPPEASPGRSLASSTSSTWSPSLVLQLVGQGCSRVLFKKIGEVDRLAISYGLLSSLSLLLVELLLVLTFLRSYLG